MTLAEDLDRLKLADPETWEAIDLDMPDGFDIRHIENHTTDGQVVMGWILQGGIQRAIQAREWWCELVFGAQHNKNRWQAKVYSDQMGLHLADTPTEAILRAYLAAMEASNG